MSAEERERNERLALAFGWRKDELGHWLAPPEYLWHKLTHVRPPNYLSGDGMLLVLEAMRERGWSATLTQVADGWYVAMVRDGEKRVSQHGEGATLPLAVLLAALAALEPQE